MTVILEDSADLLAAVQRRRQQLERQVGQAEQLAVQISEAEAEVGRHRAVSELNARAAVLLTTIGEEAQETARGKVEELATRALQVIFGAQHSFRLEPGERGGQATLEMIIRSEYGDGEVIETGVLEARGGGMAAVVSFVLRLVVLLLTPDVANVLFLDESFAHVSARYEGRVAEFAAEVARKARVQLVLITHSPAFSDYADQAVRLELNDGGVTVVHKGESE
jgi:DNA repair exonuclease SbcCD ATPase subunit